MKHMFKKITSIALLSALVLTGCGGANNGAGNQAKNNSAQEANTAGEQVVKIGVVGDDQRLWEKAAELAEKDGIKLDIKVFTDYNTPNDALADGSLDLNAFQHKAFLDDYNESKGTDLTPIGMTYLSPIGVYSNKIKDLDELKEGNTVAIPDDATNGGRALIVLEQAGVIKLKDGAGLAPTVKDIVENPKNIQIEELEASQVARSLPDVDAAVINGGLAVDAGLNPRQDTIFVEEMGESIAPYINYVVARAEDKDNELFKKVVSYYQTDEVDALLQELYKGSQYAAWKLDLSKLGEYKDGKSELPAEDAENNQNTENAK